jgi:hypothetical protein
MKRNLECGADETGRESKRRRLENNPLKHAFEDTDAKDHAETPLVAYKHVTPLLRALQERLKTSSSASTATSDSSTAAPKTDLQIWDGFYCAGTVKKHLASLGFYAVHNENEDFYLRSGTQASCPEFDVFLTNPPFSADHLEKLFGGFIRNITLGTNGFAKKPWFVLCPDYTARKRFFFALKEDMVKAGMPLPFFLGPTKKAYSFTAPASLVDGGVLLPGSSQRPVDNLTKTQEVLAGSFQCCWIVSLGEHQEEILKEWREEQKKNHSDASKSKSSSEAANEATIVLDDPRSLPQLKIAKPLAPRERRWRKKLLKAGVDPDDEAAVEAFKRSSSSSSSSSSARAEGPGRRSLKQKAKGRGKGR